MTKYQINRAFDASLDVRFTNETSPAWAAPLLDAARRPHLMTWLVVLPRRGGKTWLAHAIRLKRGIAAPTIIVDLGGSAWEAKQEGIYQLFTGESSQPGQLANKMVIIDEPGELLRRNLDTFTTGLHLLRQADAVPVLLMSPGEFELLVPRLGDQAYKDRIPAEALTEGEARRMAARTEWGPGLVEQFGGHFETWLESPFLLELLLHTAEVNAGLRNDPVRLARQAAEVAANHQYIAQVIHNGLSAEQRAGLRADRWRATGFEAGPSETDVVAKTTIPTDPVLRWYLPEILRIHHVSDLHHGGELRQNVDTKDKSQGARHVADVAGAGSPLESYLDHVAQLRDEGAAPHLVIVSGDLVDRPGDDAGRAAQEWLRDLRDLLAPHPDIRPDDPRVVLVGGNHDVDWELALDPDRLARHAWFAETFAGYPHADLQEADVKKRRLGVTYPDANLRLLLLGSAESGGEPERDEDRAEIEKLKADLVGDLDQSTVREKIRKLERIDPGVVSRGVLNRIRALPGSLSFAVLHHPISPVPAVEVAPYAGIVNAGEVKRMLMEKRTALVLHGHTHMAFFAAERMLATAPGWTLRIAGASSLAAATSNEQSGYNEIFVAREGQHHSVLVRGMRLDGGVWTRHTQFAFRPGEQVELTLEELVRDVAREQR